jgi:hypothetical protein
MQWKPLAYKFDKMLKDWSDNPGNTMSEAQFSSRQNQNGNWQSEWDYCAKTIFMIPTNWVNDDPSVVGAWDTTGTNGLYVVSIEATDFAYNVTLTTANVCVRN